MKKIGFVDYYISEWHANNYPNWIKEVCEATGEEMEVAYVWAELETSLLNGETTDEWCAKFGVEKCASIQELCEKSDYIVILCPSFPETHLRFAEAVLPYGKPTYIDKTFAPDGETAGKIFALSEKYGTPIFSTSALRYASELELFADTDNAIITGGGRSFEEYVVHIAEMAVVLMGEEFSDVQVVKQGNQRICHLTTPAGKKCTMTYAPNLGYTIAGEKDGAPSYKAVTSSFFKVLMGEIVKFFACGGKEIPVSKAQTMAVMTLRDTVLK